MHVPTLGQRTVAVHRQRANGWWPCRPLWDLSVDVTLIALCLWGIRHSASLWVPCCLIVGSRQRALHNLLHASSHRQLCPSRWLNDALGRWLLAPLSMTTLAQYRIRHMAHHRHLGDPLRDPDAVPRPSPSTHWSKLYMRRLLQSQAWWHGLLGEICTGAGTRVRKSVLSWWLLMLAAGVVWLPASMLAWMLGTWWLSRATVMHAINTFCELCDHHHGSLQSFTRDVLGCGPVAWLVHPHCDGYHLTHHIAPGVPYWALPRVQRWLSGQAVYAERGRACPRLWRGADAAVVDWVSR